MTKIGPLAPKGYDKIINILPIDASFDCKYFLYALIHLYKILYKVFKLIVTKILDKTVLSRRLECF